MKLQQFTLLILLTIHATVIQTQEFLESINVDGHSIIFCVNKTFHDTYLRENLFVTYQDNIDISQLDFTIITMPLIMNTISIIWISGQDYYIEAMDKDLYDSLNTIHEIYKRFYPNTVWNGRLIPRTLVDNKKNLENKPKVNGIALPFSHGLDSICTSLIHHQMPQLLITVRGCPDTPLDTWDKNWDTTQNTIAHFANLYGHRTTQVLSNFHEFFNWKLLSHWSPEITNWRMDTIEDLGWIGLAAPIVVSQGYTQFIVASNEDWSTPHPGASCPLVNDSVSFAGVSVRCDSFDISRPEKNQTIARICNEHKLEKPNIFVCEHILPKRKNCCQCQKCAITILSFLLAGENPKSYGFNVETKEFLNYFKYSYFYENLYSLPRACWFKFAQLEARSKLVTLDDTVKKFFSWFITIDFDKLTLPSPQIEINYDHFTDVWNGIPKDWMKYRKALEQTHLPGHISETVYKRIWQEKKDQKIQQERKKQERKIKKQCS